MADISRLRMERIHWRDFIGTKVCKQVQQRLRKAGLHLVVVLNKDREATDAYIARRPSR